MPRDPDDELRDDEKSGGWSQSGVMHTGSLTDQVSLQAKFPKAESYTVQFGINPSAGALAEAVQAEALISWSVEGNTVTRRVNVANGASVTGTGQAVRVVMADRTVGGTGKDYVVSVQVAPGSRPSTQQPPTLIPVPAFFNVAPTGGVSDPVIPIPTDAGAISVFVTVTAVGPGGPVASAEGIATVDQQISGGFTRKTYDPRTAEWVPLTPGATFLQLHNNNTVISGIHLFFSVTFGIDG